MDELTLLRSTRDQTRVPSHEALARGRAALVSQIDGELPVTLFAHVGDDTAFVPLKTRRRRRTVAWAGFSVLGAASVIVALVATNVLGVAGWNGGADPAAASALRSAAAAAIQVSDPVVGPGQYLFVRTDGVFTGVGTLEEDADRIRAQGGEIQPSDDVAILVSTHDELYVPAERKDTWVWISCTSQPSQTFGPRSERFAEEYAEDMNTYDLDVIRQFPGGVTPGGGSFGGYAEGTTTSIDYDALPREPRLLLDRIYELNENSGQSRDGQALEWIISTLQWGIVPADFRAALYKAAAEIPGVEITDAQATLDGTTGIAIGRLETASNTRHEFIVDPETGQYIGERRVTLDGYAGMPPGTVTDWTAVTAAVVSSAPTDAASCGG
ncbi:CU044_5270 family protein [Microbacterium sp. NPDC090281]|uniref:CU044_5270 family protein n=1 Tax=Microbacterium sp. NPDC090281 TaxID=3364208 RepID=UPI0037F4A3F8